MNKGKVILAVVGFNTLAFVALLVCVAFFPKPMAAPSSIPSILPTRAKIIPRSAPSVMRNSVLAGRTVVFDFTLASNGDDVCTVKGVDKAGNQVDISAVATIAVTSSDPTIVTVDAPIGATFAMHATGKLSTPGSPVTITAVASWKDGSVGPFTFTLPVDVVSAQVALLKSTDLQFVGICKLPTTMDTLSWGGLAMRKSGGAGSLPTFFVIGQQNPGMNAITEVACPGFAATISAAPRATVVNAWGTTIYGSGWPALSSGYWQTDGVFWDEANQLLWFSREPNYSVTNANNPVIGCAKLGTAPAATPYGPWLTSVNSHATCNWIVPIPPWFQSATGCGPYGLGAGLGSGDAPASFGPDLFSCTLPTTSTPALTTIPTTALAFFPLGNRSPRDANYTLVDTHATAFPPPVNGVGVWGEGDWLKACCWIDLPDKTGVVYLGRLFHRDCWYGDASFVKAVAKPDGTTTSITYTDSVNGSRGNHSDQYDSSWQIIDPSQFAAVLSGRISSFQVKPAEVFDPTALAPAFPQSARKLTTGAVFDPTTRTLYVCVPYVDQASQFKVLPVICAWKVK